MLSFCNAKYKIHVMFFIILQGLLCTVIPRYVSTEGLNVMFYLNTEVKFHAISAQRIGYRLKFLVILALKLSNCIGTSVFFVVGSVNRARC